MAQCPAGYEFKVALSAMTCRNCGCQCMIRYLKREVEDLEDEIAKLKRKMG
jgi:hypothetical protein